MVVVLSSLLFSSFDPVDSLSFGVIYFFVIVWFIYSIPFRAEAGVLILHVSISVYYTHQFNIAFATYFTDIIHHQVP